MLTITPRSDLKPN